MDNDYDIWNHLENDERRLTKRKSLKTLMEIIEDEIKESKISRDEYIPLLPIAQMYKAMDDRMFLAKTRDYLWFGEYDAPQEIKK